MSTLIQHSPAQVASRVLISNLVVGTDPTTDTAWPIFYSSEPNTPDNCITIRDTAGILQAIDMTSGKAVYQYGIQVRIRAQTHQVGYARAEMIRRSMAEEAYDEVVTLDGVTYIVHCFSQVSAVLDLGKELTSSRRLFTLNTLMNLKVRGDS
jgi:minor capsid protein